MSLDIQQWKEIDLGNISFHPCLASSSFVNLNVYIDQTSKQITSWKCGNLSIQLVTMNVVNDPFNLVITLSSRLVTAIKLNKKFYDLFCVNVDNQR